MKPWTTTEQLSWLKQKIPEWHKARRDKQQSGVWLAATTASFLDTFTLSQPCRTQLPTRIRKWFYHHGKSTSPQATVPTFNLLAKPSRKVTPLTPTQAYTLLFCGRDSDLYKELFSAWKLYSSSDEATIEAYAHFFPSRHNPNLPFVAFQQVLIKDRLATASDEQLASIQEFIDARFEEDNKLRDCPWEASKVDDLQTSVDLQRGYVQNQVNGLTESLEAVCDEIKSATNFNTFVLTGGPTPMGTGGFQLFHVEAGEAILTGQTFQQFLGPWWDILKTKYGEWLSLSYSHAELLRLEGSIRGQSRTPSLPKSNPSQSPAPTTPPIPMSTPSKSPAPGTALPLPMSTPLRSPAAGMAPGDMATDEQTDSVAQVSPRATSTPLSTVNWETLNVNPDDTDMSLDDLDINLDDTDIDLDGIDETLNDHDVSLDGIDVNPDDIDMALDDTDMPDTLSSYPNFMSSEPPSSHTSSPNPLVPSTNRSPSQSQGPWTPSHHPSWTLGPQHRPYVHAAASYLLGVPGGADWEKLLALYITFESLSSDRSGSSKLPTNPRPTELARWFKCGRRFGKKDVPTIESVQDFEDKWVAWWSASQPKWRDTSDWPFVREDADGRDWASLGDGGKDGLFLTLVSLGWWVLAREPSQDSKVDEAIRDVAWVISQVVSYLSLPLLIPAP